MFRTKFLKTPQFSIRTMLIATTLVAVCLLVWRERTRYLRTHLFIDVIDQATGGLLPRFQYQTSVITSETGEDKTWSEWLDHPGQFVLTLKVPEYCRLEFRARAIDVAGGYRQQEQSILVLPHLSHNATLRMTEGKSFQSFLIDSTTGEPICGARVVPLELMDVDVNTNRHGVFQEPYFDNEFKTYSDSNGKFVVRNLVEGFAIGAKKYQSKVMRFGDASDQELKLWRNHGIRLEPAVKIQGRVTCRETGEPIKDCEVVYDNKLLRATSDFVGKGEPLSINERNEFNLVAKTDDAGCFELFAESDIKNHRVWFSKKGWYNESLAIFTSDEAITLEPLRFELAGVVVDESGNPVSEFEIKTLSNWTDVESDRFQNENGAFRIRAKSSISYFEVHAKNKGVFSKHIESNWDENQTNERVVLSTGIEIDGAVVEKDMEGNANAVQSHVQIELERLPTQIGSHFLQDFGHGVLASTKASPNGSFRFNHVADGSYKLVTSYFGHVVNTRPVVVNKKNVVVSPIELPPLGRVQGKIRNEDGSDAPFHRSYITDPMGEPQKWFHTNHLGEFEIENVPCGWYGVGPKPAKLGIHFCGCFGCAIDGAILIKPARTTEFSYEHFPLFDLHGLPTSAAGYVDVFPSKQLKPNNQLVFARTFDKSNGILISRQVTSQSRIKDLDAFIMRVKKGDCEQKMTLVYRANRSGLPNQILFRPGQLQLSCSDANVPIEKAKLETETIAPNTDDPFGQDTSSSAFALQSELYAGRTTVFLLKQNRVFSEVHSIGLQEITPYHVHDEDPDSVLVHNTRFGWSRIKLRQLGFGGATNVLELRLHKGAEILGKVNLAELPLMPKAVRLVDEHDMSLTCSVKEDFTFEFKEIWPGKWRLQTLGYDPYLGERILAEREMVVEGIDSYEVELGVSNPSLGAAKVSVLQKRR